MRRSAFFRARSGIVNRHGAITIAEVVFLGGVLSFMVLLLYAVIVASSDITLKKVVIARIIVWSYFGVAFTVGSLSTLRYIWRRMARFANAPKQGSCPVQPADAYVVISADLMTCVAVMIAVRIGWLEYQAIAIDSVADIMGTRFSAGTWIGAAAVVISYFVPVIALKDCVTCIVTRLCARSQRGGVEAGRGTAHTEPGGSHTRSARGLRSGGRFGD